MCRRQATTHTVVKPCSGVINVRCSVQKLHEEMENKPMGTHIFNAIYNNI